MKYLLVVFSLLFGLISCQNSSKDTIVSEAQSSEPTDTTPVIKKNITELLAQYTPVTLNVDLSSLTDTQRQVVVYLIKASEFIDSIFWKQSFGNAFPLLSSIHDSDSLAYLNINYGPWDKLNNNASFISSYGKKPMGANFYPHNIKYLPFLQFKDDQKTAPYTMIRRHEDGSLYSIPYHDFFKHEIDSITYYMNLAAQICPNNNFKNYLLQRIDALKTDQYIKSDKSWLSLKENQIDFVIGPFETEEDQFLNIKTAHEAMVLIKDKKWTDKVKSIKSLLSDVQSQLPVDAKYKKLLASMRNMDIVSYNVLYFAGFDNAGAKHITLSRPVNSETIIETGTRKLEFENIIKAKFNNILKPIANLMIDKSQIENLKADAFFENSLFYEISSGFFFQHIVDNNETSVKQALKDHYNVIRKLNNDILRLFILKTLKKEGKLEGNINDNYLAFFADFFRILRFGDNIPQVKGNIIAFNYFLRKGAFSKTSDGTYHIDFSKMNKAIDDFSQLILEIEGSGDYKSASELIEEYGTLPASFKADLSKTKNTQIPIDITLKQGIDILNIH